MPCVCAPQQHMGIQAQRVASSPAHDLQAQHMGCCMSALQRMGVHCARATVKLSVCESGSERLLGYESG